jgi:hypothetical protein
MNGATHPARTYSPSWTSQNLRKAFVSQPTTRPALAPFHFGPWKGENLRKAFVSQPTTLPSGKSGFCACWGLCSPPSQTMCSPCPIPPLFNPSPPPPTHTHNILPHPASHVLSSGSPNLHLLLTGWSSRSQLAPRGGPPKGWSFQSLVVRQAARLQGWSSERLVIAMAGCAKGWLFQKLVASII